MESRIDRDGAKLLDADCSDGLVVNDDSSVWMRKKAICYKSAQGSSSEYAFRESDDLLKPQPIRGGETEIVTLLAVRLRGMGTSQVAIDAVIQKLLAFRAEFVVGVHYQTPTVNVESLRPFVFLRTVDIKVLGEV